MAEFVVNVRFDRLRMNNGAINRMLNDPRGEVGRELRARGQRIVVAARAQVGVESGRLRNSIHMRSVRGSGGQAVWVGTEVTYAAAHHEGTRPHWIVPNRQQVLRFSGAGRMVYSRAVLHPGNKPNRFLSDNLRLAII